VSMADRVENIMEHMLQEFNFYTREDLFSRREIRTIVKTRRSQEYLMQRKDAEVAYFLQAVRYEKDLQRKKQARKTNKKLSMKFDFQDQAVKRRIIHLYDRATRKFKQNLPLMKEYIYFLCTTRSLQKLNRVIARAVEIHPQVIDFWLTGVYVELDMKGNLLSARKLMLQAIRNNDNVSHFYAEYFAFELNCLAKIRERRAILRGDGNGELQFLDEAPEAKDAMEGPEAEDLEILSIVLDTIKEKFGSNFRVFHRLWKVLVKENTSLVKDTDFKELVKEAYQVSKYSSLSSFLQFVELRIENLLVLKGEDESKFWKELAMFAMKLNLKYLTKDFCDREELRLALKKRLITLVGETLGDNLNKYLEERNEAIYAVLSALCSSEEEKI